MKTFRGLRLRTDAQATLRTGVFDAREHLIVPVVMLVEGVLHAVNSPTPELVLASEFSKAPKGWDGRPVMFDHPNNGVEQVSANSPKILEKQLGRLFNTEVKDNRLVTEAWFDVSRCSSRFLSQLRSKTPFEISVGAFIHAEESVGEYNGKPYGAIWRNIVPDHLAFLPEGAEGACNAAMGCGAPRTAQVYVVTPGGLEAAPVSEKRTLRERLGALLRLRSAEESLSDQDLRNLLNDALRADEPGYMWIEAVFPSESNVVYAVQPETEVQMFRRNYTLSGTSVSLDGQKEEVKLDMQFVPAAAVSAASPVTAATAASCPCGGLTPPVTDASTHEQGEDNMDRAQRVAAIIACNRNPFTEADRAFLEALPDERLTAFEAAPAQPEALGATIGSSAGPEPTPAPVVAPEPVTAAAYIAAAPAGIREVLAQGLRAAQDRKATTIAALKACSRSSFTDAELEGMSQEQLDKLVVLAGTAPADRTVLASRAVDDSKVVPPPPSLNDRIRAMRSA